MKTQIIHLRGGFPFELHTAVDALGGKGGEFDRGGHRPSDLHVELTDGELAATVVLNADLQRIELGFAPSQRLPGPADELTTAGGGHRHWRRVERGGIVADPLETETGVGIRANSFSYLSKDFDPGNEGVGRNGAAIVESEHLPVGAAVVVL